MLKRTTAAVAGVALVLSAGCTTPQEPVETPPPSTTTVASPSPEPTPAWPQASYPATTGEVPEPPESFGGLTLHSGNLSNGQMEYRSDDVPRAMVTVMGGSKVDDMAGRMDDPEAIGNWVCSSPPGDTARCITAAWDGALMLFGSDRTAAEVAALGDELMAAWLN